LKKIAVILRPEVTVALGRKAEDALGSIGIAAKYVRYPSHGGGPEFRVGMERVFGSLK
jgi:hypothetical protein